MSQKALTRLAGIEQPTMAATLSRMERAGIVARRPDPEDGRSFLYSLTPSTRGMVPEIRDVVRGMNDEALSGLSEEERATTVHVLERLIASLEGALGGKGGGSGPKLSP